MAVLPQQPEGPSVSLKAEAAEMKLSAQFQLDFSMFCNEGVWFPQQ